MQNMTLEQSRLVRIDDDAGKMDAALKIPQAAKEIVIIAHRGSATLLEGRHSLVVKNLLEAGLATLEVDLCTGKTETCTIAEAVARLKTASSWAQTESPLENPKLHMILTGDDAAAAFPALDDANIESFIMIDAAMELAAARQPSTTPVLLVVPEHDKALVADNKKALARLSLLSRVKIIPGVLRTADDVTGAAAYLMCRWICGKRGHIRATPPVAFARQEPPQKKTAKFLSAAAGTPALRDC